MPERSLCDDMKENFDIQIYTIKGVERVVWEAVKATLQNPRESPFMLKFASASRSASRMRRTAEDNSEHIHELCRHRQHI